MFKDGFSFFEDLTIEQKIKSSSRNVAFGQGYNPPGQEALQPGTKEVKETLDIGTLNPDDNIFPDSTHPTLKPNIIKFGQETDKGKCLTQVQPQAFFPDHLKDRASRKFWDVSFDRLID